jgi:hypothetical protein
MTSPVPSAGTSDEIGIASTAPGRAPALPGILKRLGRGLLALCGGFFLYMAVGTLLGLAIDTNRTFGPAPFLPGRILGLLHYGLIAVSQPDVQLSPFWQWMVGVPRELISLPFWTLVVFEEAISERPDRLPLAGLHLIVSLPVIVPLGFGFAFWWRRSRAIAVIAALPIVLAIAKFDLFHWLWKLKSLQMSHTNGVVS